MGKRSEIVCIQMISGNCLLSTVFWGPCACGRPLSYVYIRNGPAIGMALRMIDAYIRPSSLAEAMKMRALAGGKVLCGGTDFYPALGTAQPKGTIIDLTRVEELAGITMGPAEIRIGACTSWTKLVRAPLPALFDGLK